MQNTHPCLQGQHGRHQRAGVQERDARVAQRPRHGLWGRQTVLVWRAAGSHPGNNALLYLSRLNSYSYSNQRWVWTYTKKISYHHYNLNLSQKNWNAQNQSTHQVSSASHEISFLFPWKSCQTLDLTWLYLLDSCEIVTTRPSLMARHCFVKTFYAASWNKM